jgi:uncharacterized protein YjcR
MIDAIPTKTQARNMFWAGYSLKQIDELLHDVNYSTLVSWKNRNKWEHSTTLQKFQGCNEARYFLLMAKEHKTDADYKELEFIGKQIEREAKIRKYEQSGNGADLNPKLSKRRKNKKQDSSKKNYLTEEQTSALKEAFVKSLYPHQKEWLDAKAYDIRNILKSRQIGATWYFAREAIVDACETGDNQIFLSASKAQAHIFKEYIVDFVYEVTGVELKGDPIKLWNGATLYFLGTNSKTAQGYHGHFYQDEYFWTNRFSELQKVSSGMAMQNQWRETYFSTPSTTTHEAYTFWNGKHFNKGRPKADHINIDVSHTALKNGRLCEDGQWRQIVTAEDAVGKGFDRLNLDKLRLKYSEADFNNLLMCHFVDDTLSIFTLKELQRCMVDTWEKWDDVRPLLDRPFGYNNVWVGYDPSRTRDDASLVVVAPPTVPGGQYRVLERHAFKGMDFDGQAREIQAITKRYNVEYVGIDTTGMGAAVYELVKKFYPGVTRIDYTVEVKNRLVLKTKRLVHTGQLEYDASWNDLTLSLMTISKEVTPSGRQVSYQTSRTDETGHGDTAWGLMNAIDRMEYSFSDDQGDDVSESRMRLC